MSDSNGNVCPCAQPVTTIVLFRIYILVLTSSFIIKIDLKVLLHLLLREREKMKLLSHNFALRPMMPNGCPCEPDYHLYNAHEPRVRAFLQYLASDTRSIEIVMTTDFLITVFVFAML